MKFFRILLFILIFSNLSFSKENFKIENISSGFGVIWGMAFLDKDNMILSIRSGEIYTLNINTKKTNKISNLPTFYAYSQGGLLDIQVSPKYKEDKWIYLTYVQKQNNQARTVLSRAKLKDNSFVSWQDLLKTKSTSDTSRHFGSRITFDEQGHLFFGIGDRGIRKNGQDLKTHAGSIIRLNLDGSIPKDNPFINDNKALDEIYSFGHRNPQGLFYDKKRKILFEGEHGPRGGDEVNIIEKAQNYGWPTISFGKEYWSPLSVGEGTHKEGMTQPLKVYIPSIAPSSLMVYSGKVFKSWEGDIFQGALKLTHVNKLKLNKSLEVIEEKRLLDNKNERIRNIIEGPEGFIYISTDSGKILRLKP